MLNKCSLCKKIITINDNFKRLIRISSDIKPFKAGGSVGQCYCCGLIQKPRSHKWIKEIGEIYENYTMFSQSDILSEIKMFSDEESTNRSVSLLSNIKPLLTFAPRSILDVGSGTGPILSAAEIVFPNTSLYAQDLTNKYLSNLEKIRNFKKLFNSQPSDIQKNSFDLITLNHVLEHVEECVDFLESLKPLLRENGKILIQVPNINENTFDLIVADHRYHFSMNSIQNIAIKSGFNIELVSDEIIPKQITLLISPSKLSQQTIKTKKNEMNLSIMVNDLIKLFDKLEKINSFGNKQYLSVYGTSTSSCFISQGLKGKVDFYIDDDVSRQGGVFLGKKIISPEDDTIQNSTVIICMRPEKLNRRLEIKIKKVNGNTILL